MTAAAPGGMECPQCHHIDQVQKVSAIVKASALTGTISGSGDADYTVAHDTQLSKLLASPKKPKRMWTRWQQVISRAFIVVVLALIVGLAFATGVLVFVGGAHDRQYTLVVQFLLVGVCLFLFGLIAFANPGRRRYNQLRKKWKRTYYCHRCDRFFIPGVKSDKKPYKPLLVSPEDMQTWLRARKWKA